MGRMPAPLVLRKLAPFENEGVRLQHEVMEVDTALFLYPGRLEEQVHQHGLAAPDAAPDVEPLVVLLAEPALAADQRLFQRIEARHSLRLRRVRRKDAVG